MSVAQLPKSKFSMKNLHSFSSSSGFFIKAIPSFFRRRTTSHGDGMLFLTNVLLLHRMKYAASSAGAVRLSGTPCARVALATELVVIVERRDEFAEWRQICCVITVHL
ncbi:hypothetical protein MRX96_050575 [Rhipicephalus microplus]